MAVIFGDGAGAALLEATDEPGRGVLSCHLHADGRFAPRPLVRRAGLGLLARAPASRRSSRGAVYPQMEGQKVFKHAVTQMPEVMREALAANGLATSDLKLVVAHQANMRIAEMVQRSLGLRDDQVFNNIQKYGNTTAASIPLCLAEAIEARGVEARRPRGALRLRRRLHLGERAAALVACLPLPQRGRG